jgi:hypothetical protein
MSQILHKNLQVKRGMKKSSLHKKGKAKISVIQRTLWELCKQIIRKRHGNSCYTCNAQNLSGSNWQTGHMWAKGSLGAYMKYDLRILRPQCYLCNLRHGGRGADFYKRMLEEIGEDDMCKLEKDRQILVRAYDHYAKLVLEYKDIFKLLTGTNVHQDII